MLYDAYQAQNDIFGAVRLMAETAHDWLRYPWLPIGDMPCVRSAAAAMELLSHAGLLHERPDFGIRSITIDGREITISEEVVASDPFCNLLHFRKHSTPRGTDGAGRGAASCVRPFRRPCCAGSVETLLTDHNVYLTDWANARDVPLLHGRFDLDDFVETVIRFTKLLGPSIHLVAVCQPSVPVLAAVSLMATANDPCQPASMVLMGGPIDTRANPTEVNRFAEAHSLDWFEQTVITTVPARYPGAFRRVYPGFLQLAGFLSMNFDRHVEAHWKMYSDLAAGNCDSAAATCAGSFCTTNTARLWICRPISTFRQSMRVFHRHDLPARPLSCPGVTWWYRRRSSALALMTVEGERVYDVPRARSNSGCARFVHREIAPAKKTHHLQLKVGHYGVFHGRRWQSETYPRVKSFIQAQG